MKSRFIITALIACLPWLAMAQSNDDLYFVPKKETKAKKENVAVQREKRQSSATTVYAAPGSTVVVKDASGRTRNIDEYNRRYTSRDNTFRTQNDTLYIEEKPYGERGEWVNGFEGTQDDYEYAMRIVRFRSPRYAIPVSSPLYWDVVYGAYPSWDWNVYDDGLYAYVFPTYTNPMWWDWRWNWSMAGPRWGWSWGWSSPYYYSYYSWHSPYWYGSWYDPYWGPGWGGPHHHHHGYYGWAGNYRVGHTDYRPSRYNRGGSSLRYSASNQNRYNNGYSRNPGNSSTRWNNSRGSIGRVVTPGNNGSAIRVQPGSQSSVRRGYVNGGASGSNSRGSSFGNNRESNTYIRPSSTVDRSGSSYSRPSSTRRSYESNSHGSSFGRSGGSSNSGSFSRGGNSGSFSRGSATGGSSSRGSMGGGSSSRRR